MKTVLIVMAHRGVQATVDRHKKYWERWGDVIYLCGQDDCLRGEYGMQWAYGPAEHYGFASNRKVTMALRQAVDMAPTNIIFLEYDAIILGEDNKWLYEIPHDAIWCPRFGDTRPNRGFVGTQFLHPPLVMRTKMASKLVRAMEEIGPAVEQGFHDRFTGYACEQFGIPVQDMWAQGLTFARNPIEGHYVDEACEAVKRGAIFLHGVKDEHTLRRIEECIPKK